MHRSVIHCQIVTTETIEVSDTGRIWICKYCKEIVSAYSACRFRCNTKSDHSDQNQTNVNKFWSNGQILRWAGYLNEIGQIKSNNMYSRLELRDGVMDVNIFISTAPSIDWTEPARWSQLRPILAMSTTFVGQQQFGTKNCKFATFWKCFSTRTINYNLRGQMFLAMSIIFIIISFCRVDIFYQLSMISF